LNRVSSGAIDERDEPRRMNVAFTGTGLEALGLSDDALSTFARELVEGMAHPPRARELGDVGPEAPGGWELGGGGARLDALFLAY
jgi:hypothetical protein